MAITTEKAKGLFFNNWTNHLSKNEFYSKQHQVFMWNALSVHKFKTCDPFGYSASSNIVNKTLSKSFSTTQKQHKKTHCLQIPKDFAFILCYM